MLVWPAAEHRNLGELRVARDHLRRARPVGPVVWMHAGLAGLVDLELGDLAASAAWFRRLVEPPLDGSAPHPRVAGLAGLGAVRLMAGDFDESELLLRRGLALARAAEGANLEASCAGLLGRCRTAVGDHAEAVELLRGALAGWHRTGARHAYAEATAHLATALGLGGEHTEALRTGQRALGLVQELGGCPRIEYEVHNALGPALRHLATPGRAVAAHRRALELTEAGEHPHGVARSHLLLAAALIEDGRGDEAARHVGAGRELAERMGFRGLVRTAVELSV